MIVARVEFPNPENCADCRLCFKNCCTGTSNHMPVDIEEKERPEFCPIVVIDHVTDTEIKESIFKNFMKNFEEKMQPCPPQYMDVMNKNMDKLLG